MHGLIHKQVHFQPFAVTPEIQISLLSLVKPPLEEFRHHKVFEKCTPMGMVDQLFLFPYPK